MKRKRLVFGKTEYYAYLRSEEWKVVKQRYLRSKVKKRCYVCWKPFSTNEWFDFHHKTYKNLGNERLMDIIILCHSCHTETHKLINQGKSHLWGAARKLRQRKIRRLRDIYGFQKTRDIKRLLRQGKSRPHF